MISRPVKFVQISTTMMLTREPEQTSSSGAVTSWTENHTVVLTALDSEGQIWQKAGARDWGRVESPEKPRGRL